LLLDAGNSLSGDREPALTSKGATSIEAMNLLGYDAVALGPQDFALGAAALRDRIAEADFPVLSANAVNSETGILLAEPYAVLELGGHRVVITSLSGPGDTDEVKVLDPASALEAVVAGVKAQADEIIILSTAGESFDREIADSVPGVTAIIEGGPGAAGAPWVSAVTGVPVFHADQASSGHAGRFLGIARLALDAGGDLRKVRWQQFSLGPEVSADPMVAKWVEGKRGK
jgi:2',3'-cyclic-nucleotide 2'-phosphodiesterase (5'-nucleotidase family)